MYYHEIIERVISKYKKGSYGDGYRYYHTAENHILPMIEKIKSSEKYQQNMEDYIYFALFHDIYYFPTSRLNEKKSNAEFMEFVEYNFLHDCKNPSAVSQAILATETHVAPDGPDKEFIQNCLDLDLSILYGSLDLILKWEDLIFKEYQRCGVSNYIKKRIEFLSTYKTIPNISILIEILKNKRYSIGIYPGSFDPFHVGHLDILQKAERLFDKVIVVKAINPEKEKKTQTPLPSTIPNECYIHSGLITDLFKDKTHDYTMIRGLRNEYDIATEMNYMSWVKEIDSSINFIHLFCESENVKISSSILRSFTNIEGFSIQKWIVS